MSCNCDLCKQYRKAERIKKDYNMTENDKKFIDDLLLKLDCVETDYAMLDGKIRNTFGKRMFRYLQHEDKKIPEEVVEKIIELLEPYDPWEF